MEGGDDGRPSSMGVHGKIGPRNAPTVWNSAFQAVQFWDGRAATLEEQAKGPLVAAVEMGMSSHDFVVDRLKAITGYRSEFQQVFGGKDALTIDNAANAIAAFERTLITPDSPYDKYADGDKAALTAQQVRGLKLFANVGCVKCHSGPAFNGWTQFSETGNYEQFPRYQDNTHVKKFDLKKDLGRFEVTKKERDKNKFKVPTLRNITLTAPYFHNGAVATLREAIDIMAVTQLNRKLSKQEADDITVFLAAPRLPSRIGNSILEDQDPARLPPSLEQQQRTGN